MSASEVAAILPEFGLPNEMGPLGFRLGATHRLERGGGIAARGGLWALVEVKSGWRVFGDVNGSHELRRRLREWMAGPKPITGRPTGWYARLNRNQFGESFIWVYRNRKATA